MNEIKITCKVKELVPLEKLVDFQGNLKTITTENLEKLKKSIIKYGITVPAFVWEHKGTIYIIDSHQRKKALISLQEDGYETPDMPVVYIEAKTKKEAKEKLLHITSRYGDFDQSGFEDFSFNLDIENINIKDLAINFDKEIKEKEYDENIKKD